MTKTLELCTTLVAQPGFSDIGGKIDTFMNDPSARALYDKVIEAQERLAAQQEQGQDISETDFAFFEAQRDNLMSNPVAFNFLEAQHAMHEIRENINKYVAKTFEIGRVPTEADFEGCGDSCESCGGH
ncbi:MAG: hypothetical protein A2X46_00935 [Lentisphaerae bacterium GWF2_57_35]|nr:MAG: hypothetical protein A2X46_00935 [Lentisphaerae bacterium GWF2_57_35]